MNDSRTDGILQEEAKHRSERFDLLGGFVSSSSSSSSSSSFVTARQQRRRHKPKAQALPSSSSSSSSNNSRNRTASEAASIQQSLNRTQMLLQNELQRVSHVASAIDQDEKTLQETMEEQKSMNVIKAKQSLMALKRAQQREQRYLLASIVFFWSVVAYILWTRVVLHMPFIDTFLWSVRQMLLSLFSCLVN